MSKSNDQSADDARRIHVGTLASLPFELTVEIAKDFERHSAIVMSRSCDTAVPDSAAWHEARATRITASQAAAVFPGVSITMSTSELHMKLRGAPSKPLSAFAQEAADEGRRMESVLLAELKTLMPDRIFLPSSFFLHAEDNLGATPDAIIADGDIVVEIKWRLHEAAWDGELGMTVFCQVQLQMHVTGAHTAYVYCGCRKGDRSLWIVHYSPSFIQMWKAWKDKAVLIATLHERRPPATPGTYDQCAMFIEFEKRQHSARVLLAPPQQSPPPGRPQLAAAQGQVIPP